MVCFSSYYYFLENRMGNCLGTKVKHLSTEYMQQIRCILSEGQIYILHLMYVDLAERIVDRKINLQNFLLFFHKNGFWGERLFRQFDYDGALLISEEEFIRGMAQIFKSSDKEKISLLFKFFSKGGKDQNEGVDFHDFLTMLYNYPKDDLKEILNDKEFIQLQLKKHLIPSKSDRDGESGNVAYQFQSLQSTSRLKQYLMPQQDKKNIPLKLASEKSREQLPSMIGKQMIQQLKKDKKVQDKVIRLKDGDKFIDIKTINIQQIVKKFALSIFNNAKVDVKTGKQFLIDPDLTLANSTNGQVFIKPSLRTIMRGSTIKYGKQTQGRKNRSIQFPKAKKYQMQKPISKRLQQK